MNGIDQISAEGQMYDILAPEVVNDYVEKVGKPCQNPYGYSAGSLMLAKDTEGVQRLYKATQAINNGQDILEGTNCEKRKLGECFDDVDDEIDSVKQALTNEVENRTILGSHNLFGYTEALQYGSGIVYQFNSDGSIDISGTPTALSYIAFKNIKLPKAKFILSGAENIVNMQWDTVVLHKNGSAVHTFTIGSKTATEFDASSYDFDNAEVSLKRISNNVAVSGTLYPMIRLATDADQTYQSYAMTNRELTNAATVKDFALTLNTGFHTENYSVLKVINGICYFAPLIYADNSFIVNQSVTVGTLPDGCHPIAAFNMPITSPTKGVIGVLNILRNGTISYYPLDTEKFFGYFNTSFVVQ